MIDEKRKATSNVHNGMGRKTGQILQHSDAKHDFDKNCAAMHRAVQNVQKRNSNNDFVQEMTSAFHAVNTDANHLSK